MENHYKKISSLIYNSTKPPGTSIDKDLEFYKSQLLPIEGKFLKLELEMEGYLYLY